MIKPTSMSITIVVCNCQRRSMFHENVLIITNNNHSIAMSNRESNSPSLQLRLLRIIILRAHASPNLGTPRDFWLSLRRLNLVHFLLMSIEISCRIPFLKEKRGEHIAELIVWWWYCSGTCQVRKSNGLCWQWIIRIVGRPVCWHESWIIITRMTRRETTRREVVAS